MLPRNLTATENLNESFYTPLNTKDLENLELCNKTKPLNPLYKCPDMPKLTFKSKLREEKREKMRKFRAKIMLMEENEKLNQWIHKFHSKAKSFSSKTLPSDFLRRRILLRNSADKINKEICKNMKKAQ